MIPDDHLWLPRNIIQCLAWLWQAVLWLRSRCATRRCWKRAEWTCDICGDGACDACSGGYDGIADYCYRCTPTREQFMRLYAAMVTAQRQLPR